MTRLGEGVARAARSVTLKLALLPIIFITIPLIVYAQLKLADDRKLELLRDSIAQQDSLVVELLKPYIEKFDRSVSPDLQATLRHLADNGINVKLLYRPKHTRSESFYHIASAPPLSPSDLDRERRQLEQLGIFRKLADCRQSSHLAVRFTNPRGVEEMLTSLTSASASSGCWAIITSRTLPAFLHIVTAKPFWQTTSIRTAAVVYALSAVIIFWLFIDIWRNITGFSAAARSLRLNGASVAPFKRANRVPELAEVAEDFDALVEALADSQSMLKQAAEEHAHALKLPLAIIAQSLEPLKKSVSVNDLEGRRSLELIAHSTERLDGLVSAARDLDTASADAIYSRRWRMNLSAHVTKLVSVFRSAAARSGMTVRLTVEPDVMVLANEEAIELAVENLLENAIGFAPPKSVIAVAISREDGSALLTVSDRGRGVAPEHLEQIFERHFSLRPSDGDTTVVTEHYGLGLWIVRSQVEGIGGTVMARPNAPNGLSVIVKIPLDE